MAYDSIYLLQQLPYYYASDAQFQSDFTSFITEEHFNNFDFRDKLKTSYNSDIFDDLNFNYYTPKEFNKKISNIGEKVMLSLFHINIHSLNKNSEELSQFLGTIEHNFDILVLSEIWSYNINFYQNLFPGYSFYFDLPNNSSVGGIGIYVNNSLGQSVIDTYKIKNNAECKIENIWLEITKARQKYVIGGIYRHPGQKISNFTSLLDYTLTCIRSRNLPCIIAGDINIDMIKFSSHQDTKFYLDTLILNNFIPTILMPTRITNNSATLIDHISYAGCTRTHFQNNIISGNVWCDISDHLPNFIVLESQKTHNVLDNNLPLIRLFTPKNIEKYKTAVSNINWTLLYQCQDVNEAYNFFTKKFRNASITASNL